MLIMPEIQAHLINGVKDACRVLFYGGAIMTSTLAERMKEIRDETGKTQADLARDVGVRPQAISQWENGETKSLKGMNLLKLASATGFSERWIAHGVGPKKTGNSASGTFSGLTGSGYGATAPPTGSAGGLRGLGHEPIRRVPVISWVQAGQWQEVVDAFQPGGSDDWVYTAKNIGNRSFALRIHGTSMEPQVPDGSVVIVDPDKEATNGSLVVVRLDDDQEATFKRLVIDGSRRLLEPLNPRYPVMEITGPATICGVACQVVIDL